MDPVTVQANTEALQQAVQTVANSPLNQSLGIFAAIAALAFAAIGSVLGTGTAANASIGAWKRCYAQGKPASFMLLSFVGAPLSQTIYGMILMFAMLGKVATMPWQGLACIGVFSGVAIGLSAWFQGRAGACAADAFGETDKGFTNYLASLGVIETVAIFVMVFAMIALGNYTPAVAA